MKKPLLTLALPVLCCLTAAGGEEMLEYGDFENFQVRVIKESGIIGGQTKLLYVVNEGDTIKENEAYDYKANTIWGSSNAYARVLGIHKTSCSMGPEPRGDGNCVRLDTKIERVRVMGMINLSVLVTGSLYLGEVIEPIKGADDPYQNISMGIEFTRRPKALVLDYKCTVSPDNYIMRYTGLTKAKRIDGIHDEPEFYVLLQKRWEDADGNIHARRVGTMRYRMETTVSDWQNDAVFPIHYGNIEGEDFFKPYMGLMTDGPFRTKNSNGEVRTIQEEAWAEEGDEPTHIILMLTAGYQEAFYGTVGNTLWIDNVRFSY